MTQENKIRVAVLYGGRSGEHEVSLVSATNVIQNLDRSRFDVIPIGIDKQGAWFVGDDIFQKELTSSNRLKLQRDADRMLFNPDFIGKNLPEPLPFNHIISQAKDSKRIFDVIFPVIHGTLCEDGTVQGLLELADVPYVGCGVLASAIGMDKDISKRLIQHAGIPIVPYIVIKEPQWQHCPSEVYHLVAEQLQYPIFVKPANTGSSVGVHKVKRAEDLIMAMNDAFRYDVKVVIEQGIDAIELEVAVLESDMNNDPIVSVVGEIRPTGHEFYSYASKYLDEAGAVSIIPAPISSELQEAARTMAKKIFLTLDCEGMARVDLFLERHTNCIYFNEINTIPGFTQISMYPKLMAASGTKYSDLLTHLVMLAVQRHVRKSKLSHEYILE